jgi:hypothetical protein
MNRYKASSKHVCAYQDCKKMAVWRGLFCNRHWSAGGNRNGTIREGRPLSDKSRVIGDRRIYR